mmetsp:Transcript_1962/g.3453  ORF Transcript_1962/g.3453 Transcript_1962/m.3453 type:complete len:541 (-) Transcript_1962:360-1982(-)
MRVVGPPPYEESPHISPRYRRRQKGLVVSTDSLKRAEIPALYRAANELQWESVETTSHTHPEQASYIHEEDGTTALHIAIMSRTGYLLRRDQNQEEGPTRRELRVCHKMAPLQTIEALLQAHPEAAKVRCVINSYTPLAYACCVVSSDECDLESVQAMVRLILRYCPTSSNVISTTGLSPVDVHIASYSRIMMGKVEEDEELSGRTSTLVLRTLLEHDQTHGEDRFSGHRVGGPVEVLYQTNKSAFQEAVAADDIKKTMNRDEQDIFAADFDRGDSVRTQISSWWVWRWIVLVLKYGSLKSKKKGARFRALHAACGLSGCPMPVITLAMNAFPDQVGMPDEANGDCGNLPLHHVCAWPCEIDCSSMDPIVSSRKGMAIAALLEDFRDAARAKNSRGQLPLHLAVASGTTWDFGVRKLVRAFPDALLAPSPTSRLFPFMMAASVAAKTEQQDKKEDLLPKTSKRSLMTHMRNLAKKDLQSIRTIYGLLRANPRVLSQCFLEPEDLCWNNELSNSLNDSSSLWASWQGSPPRESTILDFGGC